MNRFKINVAKALLLLSLSPGMASFANAQDTRSESEDTAWWTPYKNSVAFNEALDQFGLTYQQLEDNPDQMLSRSANVNDPLFWQKRTMAIYADAQENTYHLPIVEEHDQGRARTTTNGRTPAFFIQRYADVGDTITYRTENQPSDVECSSMLENNYEEPQAVDVVKLNPNAETQITFSHAGVVLLKCHGTSEEASFSHMNALVPVHIVSTTTRAHPVFILGINSLEEWKNMSQETTASGQTLLFDGRTRYYAANNVAKASRDNNIEQTLRENVLNTMVYDKLNGIDGSSSLHEVLRGLDIASYNSCCWAQGGDGRIGIGFGGSIPTQSSWGEWHEFGHENQMGWSWSGLGETTVNLYSIAACRATKGEVDVKSCHENLLYDGFKWDQQAVGNFLKSGETWDIDTESDVFRQLMMFAQLETSWPDLYPALGKAYREINDYNSGSGKVDSKQEKVDFFVVNASKYSGRDLREFFTRWGVDFSKDASDQIAEMKLPQVIQPSEEFQTTLELQKGQISSEAELVINNTGGRYNTAFVTNSKIVGPTTLVWSDPNWTWTTLTVPVVDKNDRQFFIKLRGQRYGGYCDTKQMNDAVGCSEGSTTTLITRYYTEDNPDLPAGEYHGMLHLIALDWHDGNWSANMNVALHLNI